jgi:hypothetical protein
VNAKTTKTAPDSVAVDPEVTIRRILAFVHARYAEAERQPEGSQERVIARCLGEGAHAALVLIAQDLGLAIAEGNPGVMQ